MYPFFSIIQNSTLFSGIPAEEIESILHCLEAKTEDFPKNTYILRAGDKAHSIGLLLSGKALIMQEDFWGNRNLIAAIHSGQIFAEAFACSQSSPLTVSVVTEVPSVVLFLNIHRVMTLCSSSCSFHSQMIHNLLVNLANKNLLFNEKLTHMSQRSTREKLLSYLSTEAQRQKCSEFDIPFSRQQLADYLSVERSGLSMELSKMQKEGLLSFHKNHFRLTT
ncbi:MAG: Crp/Fnr family transcriptional regulator [bacterium]|nr:Crp/Fnr family transcriptional regulator [bacterium]